MKNLAVLPVIVVFALLASGQEKPRVFVQGKGSEDLVSSGSAGGGRHWAAWGSHSTIDSHDEAMEVTKDLQKKLFPNHCNAQSVERGLYGDAKSRVEA